MELEKVVQQELENLVSGGKLQEIVKKQIESTVEKIIQDSLSTYGDFGKNIKEAIKNALYIDFTKLSLPEYKSMITTIVKERLDGHVSESLIIPIEESIKSYIGILEKSEWKLSEIIDKFKDQVDDYEREKSYEITLHISNDGSFAHIYFDPKSGKAKYECKYQIDVHNGKVYNFTAGTFRRTEKDVRLKPLLGQFDSFIFKLYASECFVVIDEDEIEIGYSREDDY